LAGFIVVATIVAVIDIAIIITAAVTIITAAVTIITAAVTIITVTIITIITIGSGLGYCRDWVTRIIVVISKHRANVKKGKHSQN
jgi:hypothetical protein